MLGGLLGGLLIAWILSIFNFDRMFINALYELLGLSISTDAYYVIFALLGAIGIIMKKED
ncbi:hypothetical protein [Clostridium perfringens]|uniref:hypothetical protein n=1 Tax=Clostridium perfringens TaxID=1502 RepID=UPI001C84E498|nr:hypothetical protein [Clostridium perfringens]